MAKRKKKIILASIDINHGLPYQRLHLPFMHLKDDYDIKPMNFNEIRYSDLFYTDMVVMCHAWQDVAIHLIEKAKYHYGLPIVVDLDDLIFDMPTDHPEYVNFKSNNHSLSILQSSSMNIFSTKYLHNYCGHLKEMSFVIPNTVNERHLKAYRPRFKPHKKSFTVGWTGGQSHRADQLETFSDDLSKFFSEYPDARGYFHILCPDKLIQKHGAQITFDHHPVPFLDYHAVASAYPMDVCLVGLQPSKFNECKSDLKLLEMAPHDIALISSPRSDFIQHKERDIMFYAENNSADHKSWYEQLKFCYENQDKVKETAARAKEYVMTHRTSEHAGNMWKAIFKAFGFT